MSVEERIIDRIDLYLDEEAAGAAPSMTVLIADLSAAIRADERERLADQFEVANEHGPGPDDTIKGILKWVPAWIRSQTPPAGGG
jgi:hypothetical protein